MHSCQLCCGAFQVECLVCQEVDCVQLLRLLSSPVAECLPLKVQRFLKSRKQFR